MNGLCTIDFHTHIDWQSPFCFRSDVINIVSLPAEQQQLKLPENTLATLELHPWYGKSVDGKFLEAASSEKFIGIGEVGLDRIKGKLPLDEQINIFRQCVKTAQEHNKPLTIHCVKCFSELLQIYKELRWQVPTIIHYFKNNASLAKQLYKHTPFILSLPPGVPQELLQTIRNNPAYLQRFVLETDDPDGDIVQHYQTIAHALDLSLEDLQKAMCEQFQRIYHG